jgi:hypothetical protein
MTLIITIVELLLFAQYRSHEAGVHFWLHALMGVITALIIYALLMSRGKHPHGLLLAAFGLHQYAMVPDYLYQWGIPHQPWMNIFLGHLWIDSLPYHEFILPLAAIFSAVLYIGVRNRRQN